MLRKPVEELSPNVDPSIVSAINEIGDAWMLLILWACAHGITRFDAFQRELGVARNILSERLRRLIQSGLVEKRPIADGARRMEYRLTAKGKSVQPALSALAEWASNWADDAPGSCARPPSDAALRAAG